MTEGMLSKVCNFKCLKFTIEIYFLKTCNKC